MQPPRYQRDELWIALIAAGVSVTAFIFYFRHNALLLYGDAVAHINVARRVFDSRDPGPLQLGTVWLPLPHVLLLPFVVSRWMWRSGVGGAIPSMLAYVAGTVGMFRLVRRALDSASQPLRIANPRLGTEGWATADGARAVAWLAALTYAANPNLIYLQTTAMTEPLYLALFVWATLFFSEFVRSLPHPTSLAKTGLATEGWGVLTPPGRSLRNCSIALILAMLTRYDGWFAGVVFAISAAMVFARKAADIPTHQQRGAPTCGCTLLPLPLSDRRLRTFLLMLAAVPVLWLVYNAAAWGNPLEFATGPYSARAIAERTATATMQHHPGYHDVPVATLYFLKAAKLNVAAGGWETAWMILGLVAAALILMFARRLWPLLLLWLPLPFYALSIAHGGVPLFFPAWWPYTFYNVRYGLELLPALAVSVAVVLWFVMTWARRLHWRMMIAAVAVASVAGSYMAAWQAEPLCLREARANSATRVPFERKLARALQALPSNATLLMFIGGHSGALMEADLPLRRTINETTHPHWQRALVDPGAYADYAVAFGEDEVAHAIAIHRPRFALVATVETPGQTTATIYRRR